MSAFEARIDPAQFGETFLDLGLLLLEQTNLLLALLAIELELILAGLAFLLFLALVVVGSRDLISHGVPSIGTMVTWPAVGSLFEAFGSKEKTMHVNPGGHMEIPNFEGASWERFYLRHLGAADAPVGRVAEAVG